MSSIDSNFFLPQDYICNPPLTFSENPRDYWTPSRIKASHYYQFHVYQFAAKMLSASGGTSVLDIGAGPGTKLPLFFDLENLRLKLLDQPGMESVVHSIISGVDFFGHDLENSDLDLGERFDMVICADVIEHMGNPDALLDIMMHHLTENGVAILSTPDRDNRRGKNNRRSPNKSHVREWNKPELKAYLESKSFKVLEQFNLPPAKLAGPLFWLSRQGPIKQIPIKSWNHCQMLVLSK